MTIWIKPQRRIEEGTYVFRFEQDLEFDEFYYKNNKGIDTKGQKAILTLKAVTEEGDIDFVEKFPVWDQRYPDLMKALGVEHGSDLDATGMIFEAEIKYQPDPKKPTRSWPHLVNIRATAAGSADEDAPFD